MIIPHVFLHLISYFHLCSKNILSAMFVDRDPPHFSPAVSYILLILMPFYANAGNDIARNATKITKSPAFDVKRTLGMSSLTIFYSLQSI